MTTALDMLIIKCTFTIDRQDGRLPQVLKTCAFPLWSGLHDLLNIYYSGWVTCKYETEDGECGTIFNSNIYKLRKENCNDTPNTV